MKETAQLAGFVASHAILCVSQGKCLTIPLLVVEKDDRSTQFIEVTGSSSKEAVMKAEKLMQKPVPGARRTVMAFEAYLNLPPGRTDAIFIHGRWYQPESKELYVAVPFRAVKNPGGFAVFRPKFIAYEDDPPDPAILADFLRGVALYPPGQTVWTAHLDESR
jgi:hypothetical protein